MISPRRLDLVPSNAKLLAVFGAVVLSACSTNDGTTQGSGGAPAVGGQTTTGTKAATGGTTLGTTAASGGTSAVGTSAASTNTTGGTPIGTTASGGTNATTLATTATGGTSAGGTSATKANTGGTATGTLASGGTNATDTGMTTTGGVSSGGTSNASTTTGGTHQSTLPSGGTHATGGGATTSGGTVSTGGSQAGTGTKAGCASRVVSLSANGTGSNSDAAFAHVEIDMSSDLPTGNQQRTVEFWAFIKTTDWVGEKNEIYYYGGSAAAAAFGMDFGTNPVTGSSSNHATLNPFTGGGFNDDSTNDLGINSSSDQWVHIAMTWDAMALRTYVNGTLKITTNGSGGTTSLSTAQSSLIVGCNPTNNNCFNGNFSEFRVWNVAHSDSQIKTSYNKQLVGNEQGLVGYWRFDDAADASTAADSVSSTGHVAHPGTLKADTPAHNPTFVVPSVPVPITCP